MKRRTGSQNARLGGSLRLQIRKEQIRKEHILNERGGRSGARAYG